MWTHARKRTRRQTSRWSGPGHGCRALARLVHFSCGAEASRKSAISVDGARARLMPNQTFCAGVRTHTVSDWGLCSQHGALPEQAWFHVREEGENRVSTSPYTGRVGGLAGTPRAWPPLTREPRALGGQSARGSRFLMFALVSAA